MHTYFTPRSWFLAKISAVVVKSAAVEAFSEKSEFRHKLRLFALPKSRIIVAFYFHYGKMCLTTLF